MDQQPAASSTVLDVDIVVPPSVVSDVIATTKPGITRLVTTTALVGFGLGAVERSMVSGLPSVGWLVLVALGTAVGTAMAAGGANALNQWMERKPDACMKRTEQRPLPAGRLSPGVVLRAGLLLAVLGCVVLWLTVGRGGLGGWVPAMLAAVCVVVYTLAYTPSKRLTVMSTLLGTIPGALPPMIGWSAAMGGGVSSLTQAGGWTLFALMTIWQIPHFLAIAWMYREDYTRAGFRVLAVDDPGGRRTMPTIWWTSVLLVLVTLVPLATMDALTGWVYGIVAVVSGAAVLRLAFKLLKDHSDALARKVFFASIIHLPVLLLALVADALLHALLGSWA